MRERFFTWPWLVLLAVLIAAIVAGGFFWLAQSPLLAITDIQVDGAHALTSDQVLEQVGPLLRGQSLLSRSFGPAVSVLLQQPYVESVQVERQFPHTLVIHLNEYHPLASLATTDGKALMLAGDGRVLAALDRPDPNYAVISTKESCGGDPGATLDCPEVGRALEFLGNIPSSFNVDFAAVTVAGEDITAQTRNNVKIHFGNLDDYGLKFEVMRQLMGRQSNPGGMTIDVSVPDRPVTK